MAKKYQLTLEQDKGLSSYNSAHTQYSDVTLRRAFIVWAHCGASIHFNHVCRYYHRLETLESTYPLERKAMSRLLELDLFSSRPPSSTFLEETFPNLYKRGHAHALLSKIEGIRSEQLIFHLHGFENIEKAGSSKKDITDASALVRSFCKERQITPSTFLINFKSYLKVCNLMYSISNLLVYLNKKAIKAEVELRSNMPIDYDFLYIVDTDVKSKKLKVVDEIKKSIQGENTATIDKLSNKHVDKKLENKENDKPTEQLASFHINDTKIAFKTQDAIVIKNSDMKSKIDNFIKVTNTDNEISASPFNKINVNSLDSGESNMKSGVQITILKRNDKSIDLKQSFNENYNNVVTMKARTLLSS